MTDASPRNLPQPLEKGKKTRELTEDERICIIVGLESKVEDGVLARGALSSAAVDWHVTRQTISRLWKRYSHSAVSPLSKLSLARSERHKRTGRRTHRKCLQNATGNNLFRVRPQPQQQQSTARQR